MDSSVNAAEDSRVRRSAERLMDEARAQTGLDDFGRDQSFRAGLEVLIASIDAMTDPQLRADATGRVLGHLVARLRLVEDARLHPGITAQAIVRPMFITGLPRTGTTITFDLLSLDPVARYPRDWEWLMPWPAATAETIDTDPRIALIQPMVDLFLERVPELAAIHRFDCTAPGECNCGMMHHFSSTNYWAELGTRAHAEWLIARNPEGMYRDHKRLLQQMQWKGPQGRWLLKSPQHLFDLPALFETYPDARLVWTHRDPVATFSSLASMISSVQRVAGVKLDLEEVGDVVSRTWTRAILNAVEARACRADISEAIIDLPHKDVVRDPVAAMRRIYGFFDQPFAPALEERMARFLCDDDKAGRAGRHLHRIEDYGIDPARVRRDLAPYYDRYGHLVA
jgi:hypothetical protein